MTTPRARTLVVGVMVSTTLSSLIMFSPADARPRPDARRVTHERAHARPATNELRDKMLELVNHSRSLRGLAAFRINEPLSREALAHSRSMARAGAISHTPNLVAIISGVGGTVFGEDIGKGRGLQGIRDAWIRRDDTRRILLDARFHQAGLGVIHDGGYYWVTLQAFD